MADALTHRRITKKRVPLPEQFQINQDGFYFKLSAVWKTLKYIYLFYSVEEYV